MLTDHPLPGIDPRRLKRLSAAGLDSLEAVVFAGPERLMELTGFDLKTCRALIVVAEASLSQHDPDILHFSATRDEPASVRLTRGLRAARLVEEALSMVRKARSHAGRRPIRSDWKRPHRRARKQLRKLLDRLEVLQQSVLSEGLSEVGQDYLTGELEALESALRAILDQPVRKKTLTRVRRLARTTRSALDARNTD